MIRVCAFVLIPLGAFVVCAEPKDTSPKLSGVADVKALEGEWTLRRVTVLAPKGVSYSEFSEKEVAGGMKIQRNTIERPKALPGEEYATIDADFRVGEKRIKTNYTVVVRPNESPCEIDIVDAGIENKGICSIDGKILTKCSSANRHNERPKVFSGHPDKPQVITSWERK